MKTAFGLFVTVLILFSLGLIMVFNTTSAEMIDRVGDFDPAAAMVKQIAFGSLGVSVAFLIYRVGYENLVAKAFFGYGLVVVALVLVFVPKLGMQINGASRWINVFGLSLQPSEFMKVIFPLFYLRGLFLIGDKMNFKRFILWQIPLLVPIFFIVLEPDNGTAAIILSVLVVLLFLTRVRWVYWFVPMMLVGSIGVTLALSMTHVRDRIYVYLHPETDLLGKGHQPYQAKIAAGSGGVTGRGLGESLQKLNYLPEARSDYIAAIYAEEFGFVGILVLMVLYMVVAMLGFRIAVKAVDEEGYYLAAIYTFLITFQAFLNLGVVSGVLPSKGTNLPFFSQGGSSLMSNIIIIGILMNIYIKGKERCLEKLL